MPVHIRPVRRAAAVVGLAAACAVGALAVAPTADAAFPGANGLIAYSDWDSDTDDERVATMNPDGSGAQIVADSGDGDASPAWSADGQKIAYSVGSGASSEIWVMNADGSGKTQLTDNDTQDWQPAWSPDGSQIVFVRLTELGSYDLFVMDADGSNATNITNTSGNHVGAFAPDWSPDGSRIAYVTKADVDDDFEIWSIEPDGDGRVQLTQDDAADTGSPDWSPDGSQIVYSRGADGEEDYDLWVMDADGSDETFLHGADSAEETEPVWSPDGTLIAFEYYDGGSSRIAVIDAGGGNQVFLTPTEVFAEAPDWQPVEVGPSTTTTTTAASGASTTVAPSTPAARAVATTPRFTG